MDLSFHTPEGSFHLRVRAIIVHQGRLLVLRDDGIDHDYLPGGRVGFGECFAHALEREIREELNIALPPHRLVFVAESFFAFRELPQHEVCLYYLMEASEELLERGDAFTLREGAEAHHFRWIPYEELARQAFFPLFLKERIFTLPSSPEVVTCHS